MKKIQGAVITRPSVESCRHELTNEQMIEAGKSLAAGQIELGQLDDDFKSVRDDWKARISAVEARITNITGRISRGYDIKDTKCTVHMDDPEPGMKTCVRDDNGATVWVREMSQGDAQMVMDLEEGEGAGDE